MDRLSYIADLLASNEALPSASRLWLQKALEAIAKGTDPRVALELPPRNREGRDQVLREGAATLPGSRSSKAVFLAAQARRIHRRRKSDIKWLELADRLYPLPETPRQYHNLLK